MGMLVNNSRSLDKANTYTCQEFLSAVKKGIWTELTTHQAIDSYRRDLQNAYLDNLIRIIMAQATPPGAPAPATSPDLISLVRAHTSALKREINMAIPGMQDPMSKNHLLYMVEKISKALDPKN
jgi:hypothetical protein